MTFRARAGNVTVELDEGLDKLVGQAIDLALPGIRAVMFREVAQLADLARDGWPVVTGRSRDGLQVVEEIDINRGTYTVRIRDDVPYAIYVRPKAWHGATTAWQRLVRGPMGKLHLELVPLLGPEIIERIRRAA